jgi:ABC-type spermidine/putrescine transport system permease subunit II
VKLPPQINVLATMILIVSIALMAAGAVIGNRRQRRYS